MNIRTVSSLHVQEVFVQRYGKELEALFGKVAKKSGLYGFLYGMSLGVIFFMYAGCFYFSAYLIEDGFLKPDEFDIIFKGKVRMSESYSFVLLLFLNTFIKLVGSFRGDSQLAFELNHEFLEILVFNLS